MKLLPDTLAGRVILVLLIGLTTSHVASLVIYYGDKVTTLTLLGGAHLSERVTTITHLIENLPHGERQSVVAAVNDTALRTTLTRESALPAKSNLDWRLRTLRSVLLDHLKVKDGARIRVGYITLPDRGDVLSQRKPQSGKQIDGSDESDESIIGVSVQLADSTWINFSSPVIGSGSYFPIRLVISFLVMAVTILLAALWSTRRLTAPLTMIAGMAQRLGRDLDIQPLSEEGPSEIRKVTAALNGMQRRVVEIIRERTQLIAAISHDLGTPITRLRLRAEFIEDSTERQKVLDDLHEMDEMISSILAFARDDSSEEPKQKIDMAATLTRICDDLADAGKNAQFDGAPRTPLVCRPIAIRRALRNVIENAVKYGDSAHVSLGREGEVLIIRVEDDGPGLPDDALEKVFEPFQRLDASRNRETGGTGLGLTVARTVVKAHGGRITLSNRAPRGLLAKIELPNTPQASRPTKCGKVPSV